jgi:rSAM/selenodomain-associated transferase 1
MQAQLKYPDAVVMVFAKAPVPGQVNTRLLPVVSAEQAAQLQVELIHDRLRECTSSLLSDVQLWCSPDTGHACFTECSSRYPVRLHQQQGGDLGERMAFGQRQALQRYRKAVIIGTDAPALKADAIEQAILALDRNDVVITPAEDGGYVLIGVSGWIPGLLINVEWGMGQVLSQTLRNVDRLGLGYELLGECWDVDRPEDLLRYRRMQPGA